MRFATQLETALFSTKSTLDDVVNSTPLSKMRVYQLLSGRVSSPTSDEAKQLAQYFNIPLNDILKWTEAEVSFNDILNSCIDEMGTSAQQIAKSTGINHATISRLRSGENKKPTFDVVSKLARFFGKTITQMRGKSPLHGKDENYIPELTLNSVFDHCDNFSTPYRLRTKRNHYFQQDYLLKVNQGREAKKNDICVLAIGDSDPALYIFNNIDNGTLTLHDIARDKMVSCEMNEFDGLGTVETLEVVNQP